MAEIAILNICNGHQWSPTGSSGVGIKYYVCPFLRALIALDGSCMEKKGFCISPQQFAKAGHVCHVIGAWSPDAKSATFHGNRHRYHGYLGMNDKHGKHGLSKDGEPPPWGG